jgi:hypothetical protein
MSCEGKNLSGQPLSSLKLGACQATKAVNMGDKTGLPDSNIMTWKSHPNVKSEFLRHDFYGYSPHFRNFIVFLHNDKGIHYGKSDTHSIISPESLQKAVWRVYG